MPDKIIIRKANESDLEDMLTLINAPEADDGNAMPAIDAKTVLLSILDDPNYFLIVASSETGLVGMVTLVIIMQMTHEGTTSAYITDLITKKSEDSQSVTAQLLQYTTDLAQEYGCYKTVLGSDYQHEITNSACKELGFEAGSPSYILPE